MRTKFRQLITLFLCLSLMPGWVELIENIEHLAHDGHLAHAAQHDHGINDSEAGHEALEAEHGCTPVSHNCPCHTSVPGVLPSHAQLAGNDGTTIDRDRPMGRVDHPVHRANAPPIPPPRA